MAQTVTTRPTVTAARLLPRSLQALSHYLRIIIACVFIAIGILGVILPILPGTVWFVVATLIVGKRSRLLRRLSVAGKRALRTWAAHEHRAIRRIGGWSVAAQRDTSRRLRRINAWLAFQGVTFRRRFLRA